MSTTPEYSGNRMHLVPAALVGRDGGVLCAFHDLAPGKQQALR